MITKVLVGQSLQSALDNAQPGDVLELEAGAAFEGNFVLPIKSGQSFITLRSSRHAEIPSGRITSEFEPLLPRLLTPNVAAVIRAPVGSHHYRFETLLISQSVNLPINNVAGYAWGYHLVELGEHDNQTTLESVPHHFEFDRVIIRTRDAQTMVHRGITMNSAHASVKRSHISDIKWPGTETQCLGGWNGPGPFVIEDCYLEAASINVLFGGNVTRIPNLVPSDILIRGNTLCKRLEWQGRGYVIKNLFELKNARRVQFVDNDCQYSWPDGQTGWAVILNTAGHDSAQAVIDDVEIVRNQFSDTSNGINLRGMELDDLVTRMHRINIHDNTLDNMGAFNGEGKVFQVLYGTEDVTIDHNTVRGRVSSALILDRLGEARHVRLKFINNLMSHGKYGVFGNGGTFGRDALNAFASDWQMEKNALIATPPDLQERLAGNYFPATEAEAATLIATDGSPVGARGSMPVPPPPLPIPVPEPPPPPKPTPCAISATTSVSIPRNSSGSIAVRLDNLSEPTEVKVVGSDGQVTVSPLVWNAGPTSAVKQFSVRVKKQSRTITFQSPCGLVTVRVNVV